MGTGDPASPEEQIMRQDRDRAIRDATIQNTGLMLGAMQHVPLYLFSDAFEQIVDQQTSIVNADRETTRLLMASHIYKARAKQRRSEEVD